MCFNGCTLPFIDQGECLHCAGPRQVGPTNRSLLYERYGDLSLQLLSVVLSIGKLICVSTARIWSCAALPAQCLLLVLRTVEDVLSLLG
jgi:hypothetical protein